MTLDPARTTIVSGCPGAGKTRALLDMVDAELAAGTAPERIALFTFAKAAREEAISRASVRFGLEREELPYFQTIHSLGFRQCGMSSRQVLGYRHIDALADFVGMPLSGITAYEGSLESLRLGDRLMHHANLARVRCVPLRQHYEESHETFGFDDLQRFSTAMSAFKEAEGLHDFTDMLSMFLADGEIPDVDVVYVDEAQDLSQLQWRAISRVARGARQVVVAGDDDQAIFEWAGADVDTFVGLSGKLHPLHQSYRVPRAVQQVATTIADRIEKRRHKTWQAREADGAVYRHVSLDSVDLTSGEWLVLARNKRFLRAVEQHIRHEGMLYERQGQSSAQFLAAIKPWERLRAGGSITAAQALEVYDSMRKAVGYGRGGKAALQRLAPETKLDMQTLFDHAKLLVCTPWYEALDRIPLEERTYIRAALRRGESVTERPRIRLSTIHAAKGQEADNVLLLPEMSALTHERMADNPDAEARVFYVGATRAKQSLHILRAKSRRAYEL